ncbi:MAG: response regulator transcription factor [Oleispira antarctica]|uniref:Two component transcriptional regulator, winged helix family n=1 Tax=Oleispira antarctica RB-8 TaxID=698738 RepID=R4YLA6_OLEAN|nr:response regulator transcription factor [Oleispira antarctica]MBQ0792193.1 response regulator transcription factor [Oleispira antarctica]CCK75275.1 Two component transcriptional regulator, winged helix family [Oleispira antarctica RB-8]
MQILLVEDDSAIAVGLKKLLMKEDFVVNCVATGQQAINQVLISLPDIIILDVGLPDMTGIEVLKKIRALHAELPILLLTARDEIKDKVEGLNAGADDYLTKPFDIDELIARLRVIERRLGTVKNSCIQIGAIILDIEKHEVSIAGALVELSRREYMLLKALMERAGHVLSKEQLEQTLYGWGEEISSNSIEVHIHNLRKKIDKSFISTIRGIGYSVKKS